MKRTLMAKLEYSTYYHIFNRGINSTRIFNQERDFIYFLDLYKRYIPSIADTYAWVLMNNHFHFLVRIKDENEIGLLSPSLVNDEQKKWETFNPEKINNKGRKPVPSRQFSHLFNTYSKWFNRTYKRTGSLFEKGFKRKEVGDENYLKHLVYYIHHNPIHHGVSDNYGDYPWTSYVEFEGPSTLVDVRKVLDWFDDLDNFVFFHQEEHELSLIQDYLMD